MKHRPCGSCPWRCDVPAGYWDRSHFVAIATKCRGDGHHIMDCHQGDGTICAGWAAVEGFDAVGLRLAAIKGVYNPAGLDTSGLRLYPSMKAMIAANNVVYVAQGQPAVPLPVEWWERGSRSGVS